AKEIQNIIFMNIPIILKNFIISTLLLFGPIIHGQRTQQHKIYFDNIDGFSGYVDFTTKYEGFATQVQAYDKALVLEEYNTSKENLEVLLKAGYDLRGYPKSGVIPMGNYGYEV